MRPICRTRKFPIKSTTHQAFRPDHHHQVHRASPPPLRLLWASQNRPRNGKRSSSLEATSRLQNHRPARQGDTWANWAIQRYYRRKADKAVLPLVGSVWRRMVWSRSGEVSLVIRPVWALVLCWEALLVLVVVEVAAAVAVEEPFLSAVKPSVMAVRHAPELS